MESDVPIAIEKLKMSERHRYALSYALDKLNQSKIASDVNAVYLFGSCARGTATFDGDVNLFVEMRPDRSCTSRDMRILRSEMITDNINDPEADVFFFTGPEWKSSKMMLFSDVLHDGIKICPSFAKEVMPCAKDSH